MLDVATGGQVKAYRFALALLLSAEEMELLRHALGLAISEFDGTADERLHGWREMLAHLDEVTEVVG